MKLKTRWRQRRRTRSLDWQRLLHRQPTADAEIIDQVFARQRSAFATERYPSYATRLDRLNRLLAMIERIAPEVEKVVSDDFGHRSAHVTRLTDVMVASSAIRHAQRRLRGWMKPRRVPTTPAVLARKEPRPGSPARRRRCREPMELPVAAVARPGGIRARCRQPGDDQAFGADAALRRAAAASRRANASPPTSWPW